jgi:hypothetical protein
MSLSPLALLTSLLLVVDEPAQFMLEAQHEAAEDVRTLQQAGIPTDATGLATFLRRQDLPKPDDKGIEALVRALGDRSFKVRSRATSELTSWGPAILPRLRDELKGADLETQRRLELCIQRIEKRHSIEIRIAAARRLVKLRAVSSSASLMPPLDQYAAWIAQRFCLARFRGDVPTVRRLLEVPRPCLADRSVQKPQKDYADCVAINSAAWGKATASVTATVRTVKPMAEELPPSSPSDKALQSALPVGAQYVVILEVQGTYRRGSGKYRFVERSIVHVGHLRAHVISISDLQNRD